MIKKSKFWAVFALGMSLSITSAFASRTVKAPEDWKGEAPQAEWMAGAMIGLGLFNETANFATLFNIAKNISNDGLIPDVTDQLFVEVQLGPQFVANTTLFQYSAHLRWDFIKNLDWSFYGLGGFSGHITGSTFGDRFTFFPRVGLGAMLYFNDFFAARGEFSHEFFGAGVQFSF